MSEISAAIGFNLIVISPTIALVGTALVLLFFTITIESNEIVKKSITFMGMLITSFCVFLKFGLFLENDGSGKFEAADSGYGFKLKGEVRSIIFSNSNIVVGRNSDSIAIFKYLNE